MQDIECKINLIVFNPHKGTRFTATGMDQVMAFRSVLIQVAYCKQAGRAWQCPMSQKAAKSSYEAGESLQHDNAICLAGADIQLLPAHAAICKSPQQACGLHIQPTHSQL